MSSTSGQVLAGPNVDKVHVRFKLVDVLHTVIYFVGQMRLLGDPLSNICVHQYPENLDFLDSCGILHHLE